MMNQTEIGEFIAKCRKEKKLTQAQLAERLNITDRAVSKWETGKSMPDSSIMLELCEILGITVNDLLSGEKISMESYEKKADENLIALKRKDENNMTKNAVISLLFSATLLIGIMVCLICNIAISGNLTWSLIPISSIVFVWVVSFPSIILGKKGILISLISLSAFVIPYLFLLSRLIKVKEVFSVGVIMAVASILFLWVIAAIWNRVGKTRKLIAKMMLQYENAMICGGVFFFFCGGGLFLQGGQPPLDGRLDGLRGRGDDCRFLFFSAQPCGGDV